VIPVDRPLGTVSGAHVQNFSTTSGQQVLARGGIRVNSAIVFIVAIVIVVFYLEKG